MCGLSLLEFVKDVYRPQIATPFVPDIVSVRISAKFVKSSLKDNAHSEPWVGGICSTAKDVISHFNRNLLPHSFSIARLGAMKRLAKLNEANEIALAPNGVIFSRQYRDDRGDSGIREPWLCLSF